MIHVCYGTQAELIKLAPVLHELSSRGAAHLTLDTGQHASQTRRLARHFGLRPPDRRLWSGRDVYSFGRAGVWAGSILAGCLLDRARIRRRVFAPGRGICVVHGDTLSTLLGALIARTLGLKLAHVESGLRSFHWLNPLPEELIRVATDRRADLLFAPGPWACENLRRMKVRGRIVQLPANTGKDALDFVLSRRPPGPRRRGPYAVASLHRLETVTSRRYLRRAVQTVIQAGRRCRIVWPMHAVFRAAAGKAGLLAGIERANVEVCDILGYTEFAFLLAGAAFVVVDGGSIQEESWFLDKPCLLLRHATERREGLGENVVLSRWRQDAIDAFLADPTRHRRRSAPPDERPSRLVVDELLALESALRRP